MARLIDKAKEFVANKIVHVKKPEADLTDVSVKHVSRDSATFHGQLEVYNPYDHHCIPIRKISYSLKSVGREIASGTVPDPGSLEAEEKTTMEIPLRVPYDFPG